MKNRNAETVIESALSHEGTRSRANRVNVFGARAGYDGRVWDGSFLDHVIRENSMYLGTQLVSTTAALAYFRRANRIYTKPQRGDLVFFSFSTNRDGFGPPHIGLVTDVSEWRRSERFRTVEAEVNPGTPKGHDEWDGVYQRTRHSSEVLAFVRPDYRTVTKTVAPDGLPTLRPSQFQLNRTTKATVILQSALHDFLGVSGFNRGVFDAQTVAAVAQFQRQIGRPDATGTVDYTTLQALSRLTEYRHFRVRADDAA